MGGIEQWVMMRGKRSLIRLHGGPGFSETSFFRRFTATAILDVPNAVRGFRFTLDAMWDEVSRLNLLERVPQLRMPVFFFLDRQDHWVPPETSLAYFEALHAPSKKLVVRAVRTRAVRR